MEELAAHELAIGPLQLKLVADVDAHVLGDDRDLLAVLRALLAGSHRDIDALAIDARLAAVGIGRCFGLSELGAALESRCSCQ